MDYRDLQKRHPNLLACVVFLKRCRTKVGLALAAYCVAEGFYNHEVPFDLDEPNIWVIVGLILVTAGVALRFAAHGCLKKKESLATSGVYSLCRHPLYLGSMLLTYGFCFLLDDLENFAIASLYFVVFYTITIVWEEIRLSERVGDAYQEYRQSTPLILPIGRYRVGDFQWRRALRAGGFRLIGATLVLLTCVEAMAECMPKQ